MQGLLSGTKLVLDSGIFLTSTLDVANDYKLKHLVEVFGLSGNLLDASSSIQQAALIFIVCSVNHRNCRV
jgi:hypothetical protein